MATLDDVLAETKALRADVADLRKVADSALRGVVLLARHLGAVEKPAAPSRVATDAELNGKYGDPEVKFDPRDWAGETYKNKPMSMCPADYLDLLAIVLDRFADGEKDAKKAGYKRDDAAKARGHARRKRSATPVVASPPPDDFGG